MKKLVIIASVPAEIRTQHLSKISPDLYCYYNLFDTDCHQVGSLPLRTSIFWFKILHNF
jgi:hypothetical protein